MFFWVVDISWQLFTRCFTSYSQMFSNNYVMMIITKAKRRNPTLSFPYFSISYCFTKAESVPSTKWPQSDHKVTTAPSSIKLKTRRILQETANRGLNVQYKTELQRLQHDQLWKAAPLGPKVTDHKRDQAVVFGADHEGPWPHCAQSLNLVQSETDTHGLYSQSANNCNNWIKHPIDFFILAPSSSWSCLQLRWRLCLQSSVQTQVLNSAGVAVCLPAYILIYLRALNWTSYSFGLRWSHGREGSSVTLRHAGNTGLQRRVPHAASCLKCAAETARHK